MNFSVTRQIEFFFWSQPNLSSSTLSPTVVLTCSTISGPITNSNRFLGTYFLRSINKIYLTRKSEPEIQNYFNRFKIYFIIRLFYYPVNLYKVRGSTDPKIGKFRVVVNRNHFLTKDFLDLQTKFYIYEKPKMFL